MFYPAHRYPDLIEVSVQQKYLLEEEAPMIRRTIAMCVLAACISRPVTAVAADWVRNPAPYAKALAENIVNSRSDILDVIFHVTPPGTTDNYAVAAHTTSEQGSKSGEDDLAVIQSGKPLVEVQKDGKRIGVLLPLFDRSRHTVGAIGLMYVYKSGEDQQIFLRRSEQTRDLLAWKIPSKEALFQGTK